MEGTRQKTVRCARISLDQLDTTVCAYASAPGPRAFASALCASVNTTSAFAAVAFTTTATAATNALAANAAVATRLALVVASVALSLTTLDAVRFTNSIARDLD